MRADQELSFLDRAVLHLDLIDEATGAREARLHAHFAKIFLQLEQECRRREALIDDARPFVTIIEQPVTITR